MAIDRGADIVRVHDVLAMLRVAQATDAIVRHGHERRAERRVEPPREWGE